MASWNYEWLIIEKIKCSKTSNVKISRIMVHTQLWVNLPVELGWEGGTNGASCWSNIFLCRVRSTALPSSSKRSLTFNSQRTRSSIADWCRTAYLCPNCWTTSTDSCAVIQSSKSLMTGTWLIPGDVYSCWNCWNSLNSSSFMTTKSWTSSSDAWFVYVRYQAKELHQHSCWGETLFSADKLKVIGRGLNGYVRSYKVQQAHKLTSDRA